MKDRINIILEHYKLSSAQFAETIGVQRSSISHIISGRNKPSYDFLVKIIEQFNDLSPEWLLTGKGNMLKTAPISTPSFNDSDLFSQPGLNSEKSTENTTNSILEEVEESQLHTPSTSTKQFANQQNSKEITNVNKVKSIVLIYEDNTFEILDHK